VATEENVELEQPEKKSSALKWIIIGVAGVVVIAGGAAGALFATGAFDQAESAEVAEAEQPELPKQAIYIPIQPPVTVNFQGASSAKFLQIGLDMMTREPNIEDELKLHMPAIRNNLVMLFSSKNSDELATPDGKKQLQGETLAAINSVLKDEGAEDTVEAVYFTTFVMQ
jgi:flagellar FliL protein